MGYWAKDGAYVHDEHDMNVTVREGVPRPSGIREESELDKYWKKAKQEQYEREVKYGEEVEKRWKEIERTEKERKVAHIIRSQAREEYDKKSWFKKAILKAKHKDYFTLSDEIYEQGRKRAASMTDRELDSFIQSEGKIR